jgi:radical SAM superfamily enzyme
LGDYDRFRKILKQFYNLDEVRDVLIDFGLCPNNLGTHSFRKGACTYCTSGTTAGPTIESAEAQQRFFEIERELLSKYDNPSTSVRKRTTRPQERDWQTVVKRIRNHKRNNLSQSFD